MEAQEVILHNKGMYQDSSISKSSNEFAFKKFDPVYSKEFINKAYVSYSKHYGLIK